MAQKAIASQPGADECYCRTTRSGVVQNRSPDSDRPRSQ
jgi:hypothetical protein